MMGVTDIYADNADDLYRESLLYLRNNCTMANSRNGKVLYVPHPVTVELSSPMQRVLFNEIRDANPFFHVAEFVWMLAGRRDVAFIRFFNKRMEEYAEPNGIIHGAYGYRWAEHFGDNQIWTAVNLLRNDPETRRAVIAMWDPQEDLWVDAKDVPCNTHIYLAMSYGRLNMTVCNRSNDVVWGMTGANVVHMTLLQEAIACELNVPLGRYFVMTNNLHFYPDMPNGEELLESRHHRVPSLYSMRADIHPITILQQGETLLDLMQDCRDIVSGGEIAPRTVWARTVAVPMITNYWQRRQGQEFDLSQIAAPDWRMACENWVARRDKQV